MGLFNFLKRKKTEETQTKLKSPSKKITDTPLDVPEFNNSFELDRKNSEKNAAPLSYLSKSDKTKARKKTAKANNKTEKEPTEALNKSEARPSDADFEIATKRKGKFEIKKTKDDRYVFNLFASNHVIVATSQVYSSPQNAITGIKSVIANADKAAIEDQTQEGYELKSYPKWEIYKDNAKQFRFRLSASNGSCVCHSQGYTKKSNCISGIESIKKFAPDAEIDKAYLKKTST